MARNHLIGKQVFNLELVNSENSYALQQEISDMVWKDLAPRMEVLFDSVAGKDELLRIDKMELDLGTMDLREVDMDELVHRIIELLRHELLSRTPITETSKGNRNSKGYAVRSKREHYFELWLYWLEKGCLPSYTISPEPNWILLVLENLGLEDEAIKRLAETLKNHPTAIERLILQHRSKDLKSLVELYTGFSQTVLLEGLKQLHALYRDFPKNLKSLPFRETEMAFWRSVIEKTILERKKWEAATLVVEGIGSTPLIDILQKLPDKHGIPRNKYPLLERLLQKLIFQGEDPINREEKLLYDKTDLAEIEMESPQFFTQAGVVLLHPFLNSFFNKLKLVEEGDFISPKSRARAVLLIHFLATGSEKIPEYEMVLPKFLCAMPTQYTQWIIRFAYQKKTKKRPLNFWRPS